MAILRSNGIMEVTSIPLHTPTGNEATIARLTDTSTFYFWNGASWNTLIINNVSDEAYDEATWNAVTDIAPSKNAVRDAIQASGMPTLGYKAVLSQAGTGVPTSTIAVNTLGEVPTPARSNVGEYSLVAAGTPFTVGKTIVHLTLVVGTDAFSIKVEDITDGAILFKTYDSSGTLIDVDGDIHISIEVYP